MAVRSWIVGDESAKEMLARVATKRPFLLPPPLHRVPLRVGNVVEVVGPSPSAKTEILMQAAISCILPDDWKGIHYGGLERLVMYFDLDCRFDVERFSQLLKHYIVSSKQSAPVFDEELFSACMRRFSYIRCYSSLEFLAALKTFRYHLQKESEKHGTDARFLMIDSISAFYWIDKATAPLSLGRTNRKCLSLQTVLETVVQEIQRLLEAQPMLLFATKTTLSGDGSSMSELKRNAGKSVDSSESKRLRGFRKHVYREYMPSIWQLFITHRILLHVSDDYVDSSEHQNHPMFKCEWLLPPLNIYEKFVVADAGIYMVP